MTGLPIVLLIQKGCACGSQRGLPLRVRPEILLWLQSIGARPPADLPVQTYRCGRCKQTIVLTAGDLHFAA